MEIMQGDQYKIAIEIAIDGQPIDDITKITDVEICIGNMAKSLASGEVEFSVSERAFLFPLTQDEAFSFSPEKQSVQVRVKFKNGDVVGESTKPIIVQESISKGVI